MDIFESLENLNVSEECFNEIIGIIEEYINEVSITKWKETAARVLPKREEQSRLADAEADKTDSLGRAAANDPKNQGSDGNLDLSKYHADDRYKKHMGALQNSIAAGHRVTHAKEVANLPDSKKSAQKLRRAADNSFDKREQHWSDVEASGAGGEKWTKDVTRAEKRMDKAGNLARIDTIVHANGRKSDRY